MAQEKLISLNNLSTFKDNVDTLLNNKDAYGVCSTAANVAAKTVSHSSFVLTNGVSISVKFENSNTAENPTLNVNGTGAKALYRFGTSKVGTTEDTSWSAGSIVTLVYDGTNWLMSDVQASASNTTYDLGVGTGSDSNKIVLTGSDGTADKVTVPYATSAGDAATVNGKTVAKSVPADAVFTDTTYENATTTTAGLMSTTDKGKVDALGTAATKDVATSGNASTSQVVMGNDTRLSDARPASDVSAWAKASTKPSYTASEVGLGNVTNNKQIKGLASGTTENHVVTFGTDGYTVKDSGFTIGKSVPSDAKFTDTTYSNATTAVAGLMSTDDKSKLNGIAAGAEVNQNAFSNVKVGSTTVAADAKTDTIELVQGSNITLTPDATNDKITIAATNTTYSNATTAVAGLMSTTDKSKLDGIASGAEVNQNAFSSIDVTQGSTTTNVAADSKTDKLTLVAGSNVTLTPDATNDKITISSNNTTYSNATTTTAGLMSATDKAKLNGIAEGATANIGTVTQVKVGTTAYDPTSGVVSLPAYPTSLPASNTTNSYSATGTVPVSGTAVAAALGTLDVTGASGIGAGKTISAWSETDGKVSISTQNISITKSQVSDFPTLGTAAAKNATTSVTSGSSDLVTSGAVYTAIDNLPEPMVFKGSLGTGGTITALPVNGTASIGDTYKVITAGTYASQAAKVGDTFICDSKTSSANTWVLIPSGDEPSGTVTSVTIKATSPIAIDSASAITTSGTRTISHANSGATAGSYGDSAAQTPAYGGTFKVPYVTVNATGHVTAISEHTVKIPASDNTNTTYTFANGTNGFTVTPSGGSAQTVTVTPNDSTKLPLAGGTMTGNINFANGGTATRGITATIADSDAWRMVGGQTATNAGYLEIATADDYNEPIYVRQYQYGDGSTPFGSIKKEAVLLDGSGNTSFPGTVTAASFAGSIANATGLTKSQVTTALGYTPPTTNTTYSNATTAAAGLMSKDDKVKLNGIAAGATANTGTVTSVGLTAGDGIAVSGGPVTTSGSITVSNKGVRAIATGGSNGTINVNTNGSTADVAVKGLGAMAYKASVSKSDVGLGNVANYDQSKAIKSITRSGTTFTATAIDGTTSSFTQQDNNTTYANVSTSAAGLAPKITDTSKFLKGDGTWATPTNTTYSNVSTSAAGLAPKVTSTSAFLKGDGTWATPTNTTYSNVSSASAGLAPKGAAVSSQSQSTKFLREDGSWAAPSYTTNTDTKVTSEANHYSPTASTASELKASASGGTAAWSLDVVTGVQAQRDSKGHITGLTVSSGKLPSNPNTDTKVRQTLSTTNANYPLLMAYSNNATTTANVDNVSYRNNSIYANPSTGQLNATKFVGDISGGTGLTSSQVTTALGFTPATSGHTHTTSMATSSGTSKITLAANTKYAITAGGTSYVFTTPSDTWRGIQNNLTSDSTTDSLSAAQGKALANGSARDNTKLPTSGGTMTGALNLANNTWNNIGDDIKFGDTNLGGTVALQGLNGTETGIRMYSPNGAHYAQIKATDSDQLQLISPAIMIDDTAGSTTKLNYLLNYFNSLGCCPGYGGNCNDISVSSEYNTTPEATNTPVSGYWWYIKSFAHSNGNHYMLQLALGMNIDGVYYRIKNNGIWGTWNTILRGDDIEVSTYTNDSSISIGPLPVQVSFNKTKSGYYPIAYNVTYNNATTINGGIESVSRSSGNLTCSGYWKSIDGNTYSVKYTITITWKKI